MEDEFGLMGNRETMVVMGKEIVDVFVCLFICSAASSLWSFASYLFSGGLFTEPFCPPVLLSFFHSC